MHQVLIVCATLAECQGLLKENLDFSTQKGYYLDAFADLDADLLITGVGSVATTFHLTRLLTTCPYQLLLNIGLAGSFNFNWPLGSVVQVIEDCFADLGAEDQNEFIDIFDLHLLGESEAPFVNRKLLSISNAKFIMDNKTEARGITVNKVHGYQLSIDKIIAKFNPDIESMEGAAFFYTANMFIVPSLQIRSISNYVEPRNRNNWQIKLAISNLHSEIRRLMKLNNY